LFLLLKPDFRIGYFLEILMEVIGSFLRGGNAAFINGKCHYVVDFAYV
jgi:hypothetical protein